MGDTAKKGIVEFLGAVAGGGGVENIACNQQEVDLLSLYMFGKPVEECGRFIIAPPTMECAAKVPVGGVEYFHF